MSTRQLLEDIRSQLLGESKIILNDKEMKDVQKVVSRAVGQNVDFRLNHNRYQNASYQDALRKNGSIDFGGLGRWNIFVGSLDKNGKTPYEISVKDRTGYTIDVDFAKDYENMIKQVTKFAKKYKKELTQWL
jgi:hypothetical protein